MAVVRTLRGLLLCLLMISSAGQAFAENDDLCAPFRDGRIDQSMLANMLTAAETGHLFRINTSTSRVGFCVDSQFALVKAEFQDFQGGMSLWLNQPGHNEQAVVLIRTASLDTQGSIIESILKGERFFDVEKFPEILFVSSGFHWKDDTKVDLKGDLTVHGVTRPVTFDVTLLNQGEGEGGDAEKILLKASTTIRRSDFGMDTLSQVVSDSVELCMSVEAGRYRSLPDITN